LKTEHLGEDAPIVLFIGQLYQKNVKKPIIMEDFLDLEVPEHPGAKANPAIVSALDNMLFDAITLGTKKEITMSSYIYRRIEQGARLALFEQAKEMFDGKLSPLDFLKCINTDLRESLIYSVAELATTRRHNILALKSEASR
jgi:hypothetical protein